MGLVSPPVHRHWWAIVIASFLALSPHFESQAQAPAPLPANQPPLATPVGTQPDEGVAPPKIPINHSYPTLKNTALGQELNQLSFPGWNGRIIGVCHLGSALPPVAPAPDVKGVDPSKMAMLSEFGINTINQKSFQRGQRYIYVDLFEFADNNGAYAAYCLLRRGATTVVKRGDAASEDDDSISFVQGKTFVSIYGTSADDDESKDVIRSVAVAMAKIIPEHGSAPEVLSAMPQLEYLHGSEKIVMGPLSARRFFPAPYLGVLDFKNYRAACVADYQITLPAKERVKLLFIDYGTNTQAAQASYQAYLNELSQSRGEDPAQLFGRPSNQFRNGTTYVNIALNGPRVVLVSGARKKYSADLLLRQLR